jgi:MinD-like ATPase involved in chromosome partitioning or flagellar assembly
MGRERSSGLEYVKDAWLLTFASGLARTGKSFIAAAMASSFSRKGLRSFVVDGSDSGRLEALLDERESRSSVDSEASGSDAPPAIVLIDLPGGVSNPWLRALAASDDALIVSNPGDQGIRDTAVFIDLLGSLSSDSMPPLGLVVNQVFSVAEARETSRAILHGAAALAARLHITYRGYVIRSPDSGSASAGAVHDRHLLPEFQPDSRTAQSLDRLAQQIDSIRKQPRTPRSIRSLFTASHELDGGTLSSLL